MIPSRWPSTSLSFLGLVVLLAAAPSWHRAAAGPEPAPRPPVVPGLFGFGVRTPAGRGGRLIRVTTLDANGPGSLRAALAASGPRTIVFEVGGVIDLGRSPAVVSEPFCTVAGQTAPGEGITIVGSGLRVAAHDVLIQHLRVRPGDAGGPGHAPDGVSIGGREAVYGVVIDHCSFTWAIDENASVSGRTPPHDVTFSHCLIAEGLSHATHPKGEHSKGSLIMDGCKRVALIGNLFAHNFRRNPYLKSGTECYVANNVVYNPGQLALHLSRFSGKAPVATIIGNVFRAGPDTPPGLGWVSAMGGARVYLADNRATGARGGARPILTRRGRGEVGKWAARSVRRLAEPVVRVEGHKPLPAGKVLDAVLASVGATPARRDAVDRRIVRSVRQGGGKVIDSQKQVGGYPAPRAVRRRLTVPAEGPDASGGSGYSAVERWLHELAAEAERPGASGGGASASEPASVRVAGCGEGR